jgi:hypothetical protein
MYICLWICYYSAIIIDVIYQSLRVTRPLLSQTSQILTKTTNPCFICNVVYLMTFSIARIRTMWQWMVDKRWFEMDGERKSRCLIWAAIPKYEEPGQFSRYSDWLPARQLTGGSLSPDRVKNFLFSTSSRPTLGPTQPLIKWMPGALPLGDKEAGAWSWPLTSN